MGSQTRPYLLTDKALAALEAEPSPAPHLRGDLMSKPLPYPHPMPAPGGPTDPSPHPKPTPHVVTAC